MFDRPLVVNYINRNELKVKMRYPPLNTAYSVNYNIIWPFVINKIAERR